MKAVGVGGVSKGKKAKTEETDLQAKLADLESVNETLTKRNNELEPLVDQLIEARRLASSLAATNRTQETQIAALREELAATTSKIRELEDGLQLTITMPESIPVGTVSEDEIDSLREQINAKDLQLDEALLKIQQQVEEIRHLKGETATQDVSAEKDEAMSQELTNLKQREERLQEEVKHLRAQVDEKELIAEQAWKLQERVRELEESAASGAHGTSSTDGETSVTELTQALEQLHIQLQLIREELSKAKSVEQQLRQKISEHEREHERQVKNSEEQRILLADHFQTNKELTQAQDRDRGLVATLKHEKEALIEQVSLLEVRLSIGQVPAALIAGMQQRQEKVNQAILHLKSELSSNTEEPTPNDLALTAIADCLERGLSSENPQAYFDGNKDHLKAQLNALRGVYSVMNTALNAILSVLAVCSVVGIPALWFTGTWKNNAEKNGSVFAFSMFGAEQKAKCDIYEATQALGVTLGA